MHVGLITDGERLVHEREMLERVALGLHAAGDEVTTFLPEGLVAENAWADQEQVTRVLYAARVPPWLRNARTRQLAAGPRSAPDLLYAVGEEAWPVALQLASRVARPVALDVWSAGQVRMVPRRRSAARVAAYVAPTEPIARRLRGRVDPALVSVVPMGVSVPDEPAPIFDRAEGCVSVAIIGGGRDMPSYQAMLRALSRVVRELPQLQAAIELRGPHAHDIWREAQRLELLGHLSAITDAAPLRALLTRCDALLMPERFGEMRSLTLEAMACGMAVIASADPSLDMLVEGESAALADEADAEQWMRLMRKLLLAPDSARALGRAARRRVQSAHTADHQIRGLRNTFAKIVSGDALPFVPG